MPSYSQIAPRDQTEHTTLTKINDVPLTEPLELDVYINRLTGRSVPLTLNGERDEMTDAEIENYRNVADLCNLIAGWNLTGPVVTNDGRHLVGEYDPVPIDPDVVSHLDLRFRNAVTQHILRAAFPNAPISTASRKR